MISMLDCLRVKLEMPKLKLVPCPAGRKGKSGTFDAKQDLADLVENGDYSDLQRHEQLHGQFPTTSLA